MFIKLNNNVFEEFTLFQYILKYSALWNLIENNCKLCNNIVNLSFNDYNVSTNIGKNRRYLMHKYKIQEHD